MGQKKEREVKINKIITHVTTDNDSHEVVKKVVEYWEYIHRDNGQGPTPEEITEKYQGKVKKVKEEIWELKDGTLQKVA